MKAPEMNLFEALRISELESALAFADNEVWANTISEQMSQLITELNNGNLQKWWRAYSDLPDLKPEGIVLNEPSVAAKGAIQADSQERLYTALQGLHPWRKGPFDLFGTPIDTEWHSDWKWDRVRPHIQALKNRRVLDVGCGNGYFCWRMAAEGARLIVGIDPSWLFMMQFLAVQKYIDESDGGISDIKLPPVYLLPLPMEALPRRQQAFDTVFSMGVLYHRKSPFDHLAELHDALRSGGELVLETLVIETLNEAANKAENSQQVLVPGERYARMRNVWFIPSSDTLCQWLNRVGFENCRVVDESITTIKEQRATDWMRFESLDKCLDPMNSGLTIEGYPAPCRAVILANKKG